MTRRRVELRIGELVLDGVDARERVRVLEALERELVARVGAGQHPRQSREVIVAEQARTTSASELGRGLADTIARGGDKR